MQQCHEVSLYIVCGRHRPLARDPSVVLKTGRCLTTMGINLMAVIISTSICLPMKKSIGPIMAVIDVTASTDAVGVFFVLYIHNVFMMYT